MTAIVEGLFTVTQRELREVRNPGKAKSMQRYLKTEMPKYDLQRPERAVIEK
jgi:DNA alkylation repair enzyme